MKRFSSWVESDNKHIQVSAGLALGNYARDGMCFIKYLLVKNFVLNNGGEYFLVQQTIFKYKQTVFK